MTERLDLIFHFHPALPGLALGWFLPDDGEHLIRTATIVIAVATSIDAAAGLYLASRHAPSTRCGSPS